MSSIQAPLDSEKSTKPLKCHEWMTDLWKGLNAKSEAHDAYVETIQNKILGKTTGIRIQPRLRKKLSETKCTLTTLITNRPEVHRRTRAYQAKARKARESALAMISEDQTVDAELPKMPRLSNKSKPESWIKKILPVYRKYLTSDLVDSSIKPRLREIRQILWSYRQAGKGLRKVIAGLNRPSQSDLQCLSTEVAVMLSVTSKIAKFTQLLDGSLVGASFRPRVVEIVRTLKSYQDNKFVIEANVNLLGQFEKEVQDHLEMRAQADTLLSYASDANDSDSKS
ncbi:hypothetical protein MMC29_001969 [Sticta canariensis]|nr:hypothetical protein [Sticta canariensis]